MKRKSIIFAALLALTIAAPAHADPISGAIAAAITMSSAAAAAITAVIDIAFAVIGGALINALAGNQTMQDRQASVLHLQIGESPRMVIFGEAPVGGVLK